MRLAHFESCGRVDQINTINGVISPSLSRVLRGLIIPGVIPGFGIYELTLGSDASEVAKYMSRRNNYSIAQVLERAVRLYTKIPADMEAGDMTLVRGSEKLRRWEIVNGIVQGPPLVKPYFAGSSEKPKTIIIAGQTLKRMRGIAEANSCSVASLFQQALALYREVNQINQHFPGSELIINDHKE